MSPPPTPQPRSVLLLIDIQTGFLDPTFWGPSRSNPLFESNTLALLTLYRRLLSSPSSQSPIPHHKIIHIRHASLSPSSPLHPSSPGFAFQDFAKPLDGELAITKSVNSGFIGTNLEAVIREHFNGGPGKVYLAGLTTDHCVSTTTRMAANLGVADGDGEIEEHGGGKKGEVVFVEDATAAWKKGEGKEWFEAEVVHQVNAESLREFASVVRAESVLKEWEAWMA